MNKVNFLDIFYYKWWKSVDKLIFFLILSLIILGIVFSLASTSLIASAKLETTSYHFFLNICSVLKEIFLSNSSLGVLIKIFLISKSLNSDFVFANQSNNDLFVLSFTS